LTASDGGGGGDSGGFVGDYGRLSTVRFGAGSPYFRLNPNLHIQVRCRGSPNLHLDLWVQVQRFRFGFKPTCTGFGVRKKKRKKPHKSGMAGIILINIGT
jgi:hypothetical protein